VCVWKGWVEWGLHVRWCKVLNQTKPHGQYQYQCPFFTCPTQGDWGLWRFDEDGDGLCVRCFGVSFLELHAGYLRLRLRLRGVWGGVCYARLGRKVSSGWLIRGG
jgi:hypothetical protein